MIYLSFFYSDTVSASIMEDYFDQLTKFLILNADRQE